MAELADGNQRFPSAPILQHEEDGNPPTGDAKGSAPPPKKKPCPPGETTDKLARHMRCAR